MRRGFVVAASVVGLVALAMTLASTHDPLSREVVTSTLASAGELRLDFAMGDPDSPVDVIYVPANEGVPNALPERRDARLRQMEPRPRQQDDASYAPDPESDDDRLAVL
jgi:hypothetical protein